MIGPFLGSAPFSDLRDASYCCCTRPFVCRNSWRPPGNRLKSLKGDRKGQYSIRINDQWRICFRWKNGDAWSVEITDYH